MIYRHFQLNILLRVIFIALMSLFISWHLLSRGTDLTFILALALFSLQVVNLTSYINRISRQLSFFFDAVKNEDSTLVFSEETGNRSFNALNRSLNLLNQKLQDARIEITVQEKYYKAIVESAATAIMVFNSKGSIQLANSSMTKLLGIQSLNNINQIERICPRLKELLDEIGDGETKSINSSLNGTPRYLMVSAVSMNLRNSRVKLTAIQDISYEIDRQEIDSWQKLIRILNHEIMNSVAPITSLSATLSGFFRKEGKSIDPSAVTEKTIANSIKGLAVIEEHGKGLISFVESYRNLTKLPRPKPEEILLSELFESVSVLASSVIDAYRERYKHRVDISFQVNPHDLILFADKELITRVLFNLVKNSIEAFDNNPDAAVFIEAGQKKSGRVWIRIIDNGPGIDDEIISNIFIPFFTTKEKGSGIGLSLSKQIVNMHKGTLNVYSNPGEGTTFIIRL